MHEQDHNGGKSIHNSTNLKQKNLEQLRYQELEHNILRVIGLPMHESAFENN